MRRIAEYVRYRVQQIANEWLGYRIEVDPTEDYVSFEVFSKADQHKHGEEFEGSTTESWSTDCHEVLFTEAKRVIEAQSDTLSDIDDKAM